jgi:multicomponent Na+:H+ antiporter subunit F
MVQGAALTGLFILTLSMAVTVYAIIRGPRRADRIIALDLLSIMVVALVVLYAIFSQNAVFLDVAIAYALVAFLGTVALARFLERSASQCRREGDSYD